MVNRPRIKLKLYMKISVRPKEVKRNVKHTKAKLFITKEKMKMVIPKVKEGSLEWFRKKYQMRNTIEKKINFYPS